VQQVGKLEAGKRLLGEAITLFFEERDPLAIHTLAASAQGVLRDIAIATNAEHASILHDHPYVRPERRKEWINAINAPRNFLKHADKDPDGVLEFDEIENENLLLDAVLLYATVSETPLSAANVFMGWFTTKHPELREAISHNQIGDYCLRNEISPNDKKRFLDLIDARILVEPV
jgi:hypothetical protein